MVGEDPVLDLARDFEVSGARRQRRFLAWPVGLPDAIAQGLRQLHPVLAATPHRRRHLRAAAGPMAFMIAGLALAFDVSDLFGGCGHAERPQWLTKLCV